MCLLFALLCFSFLFSIGLGHYIRVTRTHREAGGYRGLARKWPYRRCFRLSCANADEDETLRLAERRSEGCIDGEGAVSGDGFEALGDRGNAAITGENGIYEAT